MITSDECSLSVASDTCAGNAMPVGLTTKSYQGYMEVKVCHTWLLIQCVSTGVHHQGQRLGQAERLDQGTQLMVSWVHAMLCCRHNAQ